MDVVNTKNNVINKETRFNPIKRLYILLMGLYQLADKLFGATYIVFMRQSGLSTLQISRLFSIEQLLIAIFDYPTGTISDKRGRKRTAAFGFISWGISLIIFAFAHNFITFLFSMCLMAMGLALISGAPGSWLIDHMIKYEVYDKREKILPVIRFYIMIFALIASIISYFVVNIKNNLPMLIAGIIMLIAGVVALIHGEENYGNIREGNISKTLIRYSKSFFKDSKLVILAVKNVVSYVAFIFFVLNWQIYATENIGMKSNLLSLCLFIFMISLIIGNYVVVHLAKYVNKYKVSILGLVICIIGFCVMFISKVVVLFLAGAILVELGMGIEQSATSTWICDYIPSETRSSYNSIFTTIQAICGFFITNLVGMFTEQLGVRYGWVMSAVSIMVTIGILIYFTKTFSIKKEG